MQIRTLFLSLVFAGIVSCTSSKKEGTVEDTSQMTVEPTVKTVPLISGYEVIWGMDFLPNGDLLFTEKKGKLHRKSGEKSQKYPDFPLLIPVVREACSMFGFPLNIVAMDGFSLLMRVTIQAEEAVFI